MFVEYIKIYKKTEFVETTIFEIVKSTFIDGGGGYKSCFKDCLQQSKILLIGTRELPSFLCWD
jgi:hypothetical protein